MHFLVMKMNPLAMLEFITPFYITYIHQKDNTYIKMANPMLERLWDGQYPHISQQKVILSHVICEILCNMRKLVH
jgi:hypothetical protein